VAVAVAESVMVTVTEDEPDGPVGVPLIIPAAAILNPAGRPVAAKV
jgi:hypothetical protein